MSVNSLTASVGISEFKKESTGAVDTLKILCYNVRHCSPPGTNKIDIDAIVNVIKNSNASIVALQEIDVNTSRSGKNLNEAEALAKACGMYFYFGKAIDFAGGEYGVAILSKYPMSDEKATFLSKEANPKMEQRVLLTAKIKISKKQTIRFACTHLDSDDENNRLLQVSEIVKIAENDSMPFIIAGDFNSTPESAPLKIVDKSFQRSCDECGLTFPQDVPDKCIDFIAFQRRVSKKIKTIRHFVINDSYASDHRPIYAELYIKGVKYKD